MLFRLKILVWHVLEQIHSWVHCTMFKLLLAAIREAAANTSVQQKKNDWAGRVLLQHGSRPPSGSLGSDTDRQTGSRQHMMQAEQVVVGDQQHKALHNVSRELQHEELMRLFLSSLLHDPIHKFFFIFRFTACNHALKDILGDPQEFRTGETLKTRTKRLEQISEGATLLGDF